MQSTNSYRRALPGLPVFLFGVVIGLFLVAGLVTLYVELVGHVLQRLAFSPRAILITLLGIFVGGFVNIPLHRRPVALLQLTEWITFYRRWGEEPFPIGLLQGNTIAINIGGAVVPVCIAVWQVMLLSNEPLVLLSLLLASCVSVLVCYRLGRFIADVGIMLPAWAAPFVGIAGAWLLLPAGSPHYASFAFVTAVLGPFIGADLLNLKDVDRLGNGTLSIGGAGPLDGIVLSGFLAAGLV